MLNEGEKFGRLSVLGFSHKDKHYRKHYTVICDCGKTKTVQGSLLTTGNTLSCGCLSLEIKKSKLLPNDKSTVNFLILQYKRHARRRNLKFDLGYDVFYRLINEACHYCGLTKQNLVKTKNNKLGMYYNGIDRTDSTGDYSEDNVVSCCGTCNKMKTNTSYSSFKDKIKKIYENMRL